VLELAFGVKTLDVDFDGILAGRAI